MKEADVAFALDVPANTGQVRTVRLFVSAIARQHGCEETSIEDLKLAVSEGCNLALSTLDEGAGDRLKVLVDVGDQGLAFQLSSVRNQNSGAKRPTTDGAAMLDAATMGRDLITALFPEAQVKEDEQGAKVELLLPI